MKSGRPFTAATQHLTPTVVIIKNLVKVGSLKATKPKLKSESSDSVLLSLFTREVKNTNRVVYRYIIITKHHIGLLNLKGKLALRNMSS